MTSSEPFFLNVHESNAVREKLDDPVTRNLVQFAMFKATVRMARPAEMSDSDFHARLPSAPIDLVFYASVMAEVFADHAFLRRVLDGQSLAAASGWPED